MGYLDQRFYTSQFGRFLSADRFARSSSVFDSGSWNKYMYVLGDPVNSSDPFGTCGESTEKSDTGCDNDPPSCTDDDANQFDCTSATGGDDNGPLIGTATGVCGQACVGTTSDPGDPDDPGDPGEPIVVGSGQTSPISGGTYNSCVAGSIGVGTAIGSGVGAGVGGAIGGNLGAAGGTYILPGFGTIAIGTFGIEIGITGGTLAGGSIGGAIGGWAGSILCKGNRGGQRKGERGGTAKPTGTNNPGKHAKPDPNRPGEWQVKDPHTAIWKPKPPGWKP